jgi:hypothetical protein
MRGAWRLQRSVLRSLSGGHKCGTTASRAGRLPGTNSALTSRACDGSAHSMPPAVSRFGDPDAVCDRGNANRDLHEDRLPAGRRWGTDGNRAKSRSRVTISALCSAATAAITASGRRSPVASASSPELAQQVEVTGAWRGREVLRLCARGFEERECVSSRSWHLEDPAIGRQAQERRPDGQRHRELLIAGQQLVEPEADLRVLGMVGAVRREHDVYVQVQHLQRRALRSLASSSASCNARLEVRSIPARGPVPPRNTGTGGATLCRSGWMSSRRSAASRTSPSK